MEQTGLNQVRNDVEELKKAVANMQEYIEDCFLTKEEEERLEIGLKEFEDGETITLEDLEQELDNGN